jgi:hypothetical protein
MPADYGVSIVLQVADAKQELKDAKDQVATMKDQYSVLTKEAQNSTLEVCECCRSSINSCILSFPHTLPQEEKIEDSLLYHSCVSI